MTGGAGEGTTTVPSPGGKTTVEVVIEEVEPWLGKRRFNLRNPDGSMLMMQLTADRLIEKGYPIPAALKLDTGCLACAERAQAEALDPMVEFQTATGITDDHPDYTELFDEWVAEQRASQATCDLEADRNMGRIA